MPLSRAPNHCLFNTSTADPKQRTTNRVGSSWAVAWTWTEPQARGSANSSIHLFQILVILRNTPSTRTANTAGANTTTTRHTINKPPTLHAPNNRPSLPPPDVMDPLC